MRFVAHVAYVPPIVETNKAVPDGSVSNIRS